MEMRAFQLGNQLEGMTHGLRRHMNAFGSKMFIYAIWAIKIAALRKLPVALKKVRFPVLWKTGRKEAHQNLSVNSARPCMGFLMARPRFILLINL